MKPFSALTPLLTNFSAKVFISLVSAMVLLFSLVNFLHNRTQTKAFEKEIMKDGTVLTQVTANAARLGLFAENAKLLQRAVMPTLATEGVLAIFVMNKDRKILIREHAPKVDRQLATCLVRMPEDEQELHMRTIEQSFAPVFIDGKEIIEFWIPVRGADTQFSPDSLYFPDTGLMESTSSQILGFVGVVLEILKEGQQKREAHQAQFGN